MRGLEDHVAGALLQPARTRFGLPQTAFADPLGIARAALSGYESGRRRPTSSTGLRLELTALDHHEAVPADCTLDEVSRRQLRTHPYRLASDAA